LVCVAANSDNSIGGCDVGGGRDQWTLAFLTVMAIVLARSLNRKRR
jgi:hypothetical protein